MKRIDFIAKVSYHCSMAVRNYTSALSGRTGLQAHRGSSEPWTQPTGRIDATTAAAILGFQEHDIAVLVSEGLLEPLGKPVQNAVKYFAAVYILALAEDPVWLSKATQAVYEHWKTRNANRANAGPQVQKT